jgi:hypothetical protein
LDGARDHDGHFVARQGAVSVKLTVGVSLDQTVGGKALDVLVGPVIGRYIRERRREGGLAMAQTQTDDER